MGTEEDEVRKEDEVQEEDELEELIGPAAPKFEELVDVNSWYAVEDFFRNADALISDDVSKAVQLRRQLRKELLESDPQLAQQIKKPTTELLEWGRKQLFGGNVCAVDGTISRSPSLSGGRARVGVVATSYSGNRIQKVLWVSYRQLAQPAKSAIEYFDRLKKVNRISELMLRAVMAYAERSIALGRPEEWRLVHGELLPFELWGALGKGRPLRHRLDLAERLIESKKIVAVIEGSTHIELLNSGELLEKGEYLDVRELASELRAYRKGRQADGRAAHFSQKEGEEFDKFADRFGPKIRVGIFKAAHKTFILQAHKDFFHEAAAIVLADAAHQPLRGFPLLIDYADHILGHYLAQGEFDRQIQFKAARLGEDVIGAEIDPRKTRRG